ncbi:MAG: hypothetical protein N2747_02260 [Chitinophagaceae bacterium]|nr:hypothetical protein [Chitinophagaceae bacterium]
MEPQTEQNLFDIHFNESSTNYIKSISNWTRVLAISILSIAGLVLLLFIIMGKQVIELIRVQTFNEQYEAAGFFIGVLLVLILILGLWLYFLIKASVSFKKSLSSSSNQDLAEGFKHLRNFFILNVIIGALNLITNLLELINL